MAMTLSFRGKMYYILASPNEDMETKFKYLMLVIPKTMGGLIFIYYYEGERLEETMFPSYSLYREKPEKSIVCGFQIHKPSSGF